MLDYIKGRVVTVTEGAVTLENNGIGYMIYTSKLSAEKLREAVDTVTVYVWLHMNDRTGEAELYGFAAAEERAMFLKLISVTGVGAKAGLAILSVATPEKLALAIITNDTRLITKAQGVGPKAAQRIVLELKDKIKNEEVTAAADDGAAFDKASDNAKEAIDALTVLGYSGYEARTAVSKLDCSADVEDILREALKLLMK